jgi:hypothetical protein
MEFNPSFVALAILMGRLYFFHHLHSMALLFYLFKHTLPFLFFDVGVSLYSPCWSTTCDTPASVSKVLACPISIYSHTFDQIIFAFTFNIIIDG